MRIHSQCFTGEVLGSLRCDCNDQLDIAMRAIAAEGRGLLIYEHQEGRGIGLMAKLQAYALQDAGLDTVDANHALGFRADCRDFSLPAAILHELGVSQVRLLSNNPRKSRALCRTPVSRSSSGFPAKPRRPRIPLLTYVPRKNGWGTPSAWVSMHRTGHPTTHSQDLFEFASIETAIRELRAGRMIVVIDDEDRENEGDLTMAAELVTPEAINFMATHGRGLICLAMTGERLDELDLAAMVPDNTALSRHRVHGLDRRERPRRHHRHFGPRSGANDPGRRGRRQRSGDFARPGHVFPLRACPGGVLERRDRPRRPSISPASPAYTPRA